MKQHTAAALNTAAICLVWYALSSFNSQMTKAVLQTMPFPFFLAQIQFIVSGSLSFCLIHILRMRPELADSFSRGSVPLSRDVPLFRRNTLLKILPLGLLQASGKYVSLRATQIVPVATVASIKALSPMLLVLGYRIFYNVKLPILTYLSLVPLLGGVVLITRADVVEGVSISANPSIFEYLETEHMKGIFFCIVSVLFIAIQQIYGKELITWDQFPSTDTVSHVLEVVPVFSSIESSPSGHKSTVPYTPGGISSNSHAFSNSPNSLSGFNQRAASHLPYSVSDLNLNNLDPNSPVNPYILQAKEAQKSTNPLAASLIGNAKPDKLTVIFYIALIGFSTSTIGFLTKEAPGVISSMSVPDDYTGSAVGGSEAFKVVMIIALISLCHFAQTLISFHLLGSIPALTYSIASMMKRIVIIIVSIVVTASLDGEGAKEAGNWLGLMSSQQVAGLTLIGIGLYSYDRWGSTATKRARR